MYQLYGAPNVASFAPHICLIKAGVNFEFIQVDMVNKEQHGDAYKAMNPTGRIPVLIDKGIATKPLIIFETAATCLHIADRHLDANLFPALGTVERATAYKWLMFLTNTMQTELLVFHYADRYTSDINCVPANKARMAERIADMFTVMAAERAIGDGFLAGKAPSICDYFLFMLSEWAHSFNLKNGPMSHPTLVNYLTRVKALPEIQETIAREGFTPVI